jgi:hypothetical protein
VCRGPKFYFIRLAWTFKQIGSWVFKSYFKICLVNDCFIFLWEKKNIDQNELTFGVWRNWSWGRGGGPGGEANLHFHLKKSFNITLLYKMFLIFNYILCLAASAGVCKCPIALSLQNHWPPSLRYYHHLWTIPGHFSHWADVFLTLK